MGKIFNALEKYRQERQSYLANQKLRKSDWDVLLQYDRETGKLTLRAGVIAKNRVAVQRLLTNRMILRDGTLTVKGRKICEGMARVMKLPQTRQQPDHVRKEIKHRKADTIPDSKKLNAADWSVLMKYDRETGNLLKFDPEIGQLTKDSKAVLREPDTIQRLIESNMILPGGWLTASAKRECEKRERKLKKPLVNDLVAKKAQENRITESQPSDVSVLNKREKAAPQKLQPAALAIDKEPPAVTPKNDAFILGEERGEKVGDAKPEKTKSLVKVPLSLSKSRSIDRNLISLLEPNSFEAEQFKMLRTNLLYPVSGRAPRSVLVTSVMPAEGKSFVAANLAVSVAHQINRHVLLMDCDLRNPIIHRRFGFGDGPGLSEYLTNGNSLSSLLLPTEINGLTILPGGKPPPNPSELMSSDRMSALMEEVTNRYSDRLIIVDSPPSSMTAETGVLARQVEGILLVIKFGKTRRKDVENLIELLGKDKIVGGIINNFDMHAARYYGYKKYRNYNHID